jgi:glyceraldehyde-3-phosphate dehydrogenase (NADP+)
MRIYHEEQFGPILPIATFKTLQEVYHYLATSPYGQQASVFSQDPKQVHSIFFIYFFK